MPSWKGAFLPIILAEELVLPKIIDAIKNYRNERESKVLLEKAVRALGWTFFLSVLLFVLLWFFKRVEKFIEKRFSREIDKLEVKSLQVVKIRADLAGTPDHKPRDPGSAHPWSDLFLHRLGVRSFSLDPLCLADLAWLCGLPVTIDELGDN